MINSRPTFRTGRTPYRGGNRQLRFKIINDGSTSDENKLGAIGDINLVMTRENLSQDDLLVIAGDNLFSEPLTGFVEFARDTEATVALFDVGVSRRSRNMPP